MRTFARKRPREGTAPTPFPSTCTRTAPPEGTPSTSGAPSILHPGRLARQDYGALSVRLDDLEFALDGLKLPNASVSVLRRSATDIVALLVERSQRTVLFCASGVLRRLMSALASVQSADAHVSLAISTVADLVARDAAAGSVADSLVACLLAHLKLGSTPPQSEVGAAPHATLSEELWALVKRLDARGLVLGDGSCTEKAMRTRTRRVCLSALHASSAAVGCRAELRKQGCIPIVLKVLEEAVLSEEDLKANWTETESVLNLVQIISFDEASCANGWHQAEASPASRDAANVSPDVLPVEARGKCKVTLPLNIQPVLRVAALITRELYGCVPPAAGAKTPGHAPEGNGARRSTAKPARTKGGEKSRNMAQDGAYLQTASSAHDSARSAHACPSCSRSLEPAQTKKFAGLVCDGGCGLKLKKGDRRFCCASCDFDVCLQCCEKLARAVPQQANQTEEDGAGRADEGLVAAPEVGCSQSSRTTAPSEWSERSEEEAAASGDSRERQLLLHALRALVNLTNGSAANCAQLVRSGVPLVAHTLACEWEGGEARGGLPHHYDTTLMALGLLANCLELCADAQDRTGSCVAMAADVRRGPRTLVSVLSESLGLLIHSTQPGGADDMERQVTAAYTALVLGFLCRDHRAHCEVALTALQQDNFQVVAGLLQSFSQLYSEAALISPESSNAMNAIIEWMNSYRV
ncbi:hypothetical protein AB1Y20_001208 [Prymnesium parvum]|uniref:Uncharacterized protein n=1 Tax=Prymnesium parvum TaxID=97485 RepID=A0AB34KAR8_PRYPA